MPIAASIGHTKQPGQSWGTVRPYTTVYVTPSPGSVFLGRYLHTWNTVGAQKLGVGNVSPRAFWRFMFR